MVVKIIKDTWAPHACAGQLAVVEAEQPHPSLIFVKLVDTNEIIPFAEDEIEAIAL